MDELQSLSIIKLGEPLLSAAENDGRHDAGRMSDASSNAPQSDIPTPASLQADLTHYKVYPILLLRWSHTNLKGTLHEIEIQLRRASHEREVPTRCRG